MGTTLLNQVNVLVSQSSGTSVSLTALESLDRSITVTSSGCWCSIDPPTTCSEASAPRGTTR